MNTGEALRMLQQAREAGRLALIDHELRFLPGRIKMRELLREGKIGTVWHARLTLSSDSRADLKRPWDWWSDITKGGGALGALASHAIDGFRWVLGAEVSEVVCHLATHVKERRDKKGEIRKVTTDDEATVMLRFTGNDLVENATGSISVSTVEAGKPSHRLEIFGSKGALSVEDNQLQYGKVGAGKWEPIVTDEGELAPGMRDNDWSRGFTAFSKEIVKALREGRTEVPGAATFEDGYRTQLVLDAARRSNDSGDREAVGTALQIEK
jgi:predicted dehydrogenase